MDNIPKAIEDLMAADSEGEVEIVLRRARRAPMAEPVVGDEAGAAAPPTDLAPGAPAGGGPPLTALQASLNRGSAKPRAPKSYSMPRKPR